MVLNLQLKSLIISFAYGIILAYLIKLNYKYLFSGRLVLRITVTVLFVLDNFLFYFLILRFINNASFHIYFLFLMAIGYMLGYRLISKR